VPRRAAAERATLIALGLSALACSSSGAPHPEGGVQPSSSIASQCAPQQDRGEGSAWVQCALGRMSLREKAAQMVWPTTYGDYVAADAPVWERLQRYVKQDKVGGLIVSIGSPLEIAAKLNELQRMSDVPLLVGADLEAGAGFRARGGYFLPNAIELGGATMFPPQMALGATGDTALAFAQGQATAEEGRALGIHVAFAPVLDVNNNPANPVINTRSFGEDPAQVARLGAALIRGVQSRGMIATGKHFPGHGDTGSNSHLSLPVVSVSRARLDSVELVPFRAGVAAGVGAMMTFHGAMPALDSSGVPGTLSAKVLGGLLRDEMKFQGLVVSDAMDMRGVLDTYGPVEAAVRAVAAGADILIQPVDAEQAIDAVVSGVKTGRYDEARLDRSVQRILAAKHRLGLARQRVVSLDSARFVVGDSAHLALARSIAERSITLVKDSLRMVPLGRLVAGARVLSVTYARRSDLGAGVTFDAELRRHFPALRSEYVSADDASPDFTRLLRTADSADVVVVGSYVATAWNASSITAPRAFTDFVHVLLERGKPPVLVSFGNPYVLQQMPDVPAYVVAWGGFPVSQSAAARALLGEVAIGGRLPIQIPPLTTMGAGQSRAPLSGVSGARGQ